MKRCAPYMRVSTVDQHPENQLHDLRNARQGKFESPKHRGLTEVAKAHGISRALVSRIMRDENAAGHEGFPPAPSQTQQNRRPGSVA
jgi:hypothetical protein